MHAAPEAALYPALAAAKETAGAPLVGGGGCYHGTAVAKGECTPLPDGGLRLHPDGGGTPVLVRRLAATPLERALLGAPRAGRAEVWGRLYRLEGSGWVLVARAVRPA